MKSCRGYVQGYFTLELSLLFPVVMGIMLLVIYLGFYQYDRSLQELDNIAIVVRGIEKQNMTAKERVDYTQQELSKIYWNKYVAWELEENQLLYAKKEMKIHMKGCLEFPFGGLNFWSNETTWKADCEYSGTVVTPTYVLRAYRKAANLIGY